MKRCSFFSKSDLKRVGPAAAAAAVAGSKKCNKTYIKWLGKKPYFYNCCLTLINHLQVKKRKFWPVKIDWSLKKHLLQENKKNNDN